MDLRLTLQADVSCDLELTDAVKAEFVKHLERGAKHVVESIQFAKVELEHSEVEVHRRNRQRKANSV